MSFVWGKVALVAGERAIAQEVGGDGTSSLLIGNESGLSVTVTLEGANVSRTLYPGTVDIFDLPRRGHWTGNVFFDCVSTLSNASTWPSSFAQIDVFGIGERPQGTYPISLARNSNIGNGETVGGLATNIVNDNNASGSKVIEATVLADIASAITLLNNGQLTLGDAAFIGFITLVSNALGNLVFGNGKISSTIDLTIQVAAGKTLTIKAGGFPIATISATQLQANTVAFSSGTLTNISHFSGTGPGSVAHGLGAIPDIVLISYHGPYGAPPTALLSYDSEDATNVHIVAQAAYNWQAVAIKF